MKIDGGFNIAYDTQASDTDDHVIVALSDFDHEFLYYLPSVQPGMQGRI